MQTEIRKDQNIKTKTKRKTDADSAGHQIGRDIQHNQQKWQNVEIAKEEAKTKRCADRQNEYNMWKKQHRRQKKTNRQMIEFKK